MRLRLVVLCALAVLSAPALSASPELFVHYMPWYEAKPVSPQWGWHWTMNHYNPDKVNTGQRRQIASHYYPLIGPYDSSDPHVLEYHALLMKLAGIDGVIIDWYGTTAFRDYGVVHRNTGRLIEILKRFGLKFAICYEDQSVKHMVESGFIRPELALDQGRQHLRWLRDRWFKESLYAKWQGKRLLLVFGPQHFKSDQWKELFASVGISPSFITLDHLHAPAVGVYSWPPMWMSKDKKLTLSQVEEYLKSFYAKPTLTIGVGFPGFHDIYEQAGVHPSYGFLDAENGKVLTTTLRRAKESKSPFVQIATWNDFGEGTQIEPTREHRYRYLQIVRKFQEEAGRPSLPSDDTAFELPLRIYTLRKLARTPATKTALEQIVGLMKTRDYNKAQKRLTAIEIKIRKSKSG
jgi:hypothetical protein